MDYVRDLRRANLVGATIVRRRNCIITLACWVEPRRLDHVTGNDIQAMLDHRGLSPRTRYHWISHIHAFYSWAVRHGRLPLDPTTLLPRPKLPKLLPRPICDADLAVSLDCSHGHLHAWIALASFCGLRCAEIAGLDAADILDGGHLIRVYGKGSKERIVPLHTVAAEALGNAGARRSGPIWPTAPTPAEVSKQIATYHRGLGIDATAHQLRHWYGTKLYQATRDLRLVQEMMGHASPNTTAGYAAFDQSTARAAVEKIGLPT